MSLSSAITLEVGDLEGENTLQFLLESHHIGETFSEAIQPYINRPTHAYLKKENPIKPGNGRLRHAIIHKDEPLGSNPHISLEHYKEISFDNNRVKQTLEVQAAPILTKHDHPIIEVVHAFMQAQPIVQVDSLATLAKNVAYDRAEALLSFAFAGLESLLRRATEFNEFTRAAQQIINHVYQEKERVIQPQKLPETQDEYNTFLDELPELYARARIPEKRKATKGDEVVLHQPRGEQGRQFLDYEGSPVDTDNPTKIGDQIAINEDIILAPNYVQPHIPLNPIHLFVEGQERFPLSLCNTTVGLSLEERVYTNGVPESQLPIGSIGQVLNTNLIRVNKQQGIFDDEEIKPLKPARIASKVEQVELHPVRIVDGSQYPNTPQGSIGWANRVDVNGVAEVKIEYNADDSGTKPTVYVHIDDLQAIPISKEVGSIQELLGYRFEVGEEVISTTEKENIPRGTKGRISNIGIWSVTVDFGECGTQEYESAEVVLTEVPTRNLGDPASVEIRRLRKEEIEEAQEYLTYIIASNKPSKKVDFKEKSLIEQIIRRFEVTGIKSNVLRLALEHRLAEPSRLPLAYEFERESPFFEKSAQYWRTQAKAVVEEIEHKHGIIVEAGSITCANEYRTFLKELNNQPQMKVVEGPIKNGDMIATQHGIIATVREIDRDDMYIAGPRKRKIKTKNVRKVSPVQKKIQLEKASNLKAVQKTFSEERVEAELWSTAIQLGLLGLDAGDITSIVYDCAPRKDQPMYQRIITGGTYEF